MTDIIFSQLYGQRDVTVVMGERRNSMNASPSLRLMNRTPIGHVQTWKPRLLAEACAWGCMIITCKILDTGADPNLRRYLYPGQASLVLALIYAASHGHVELMEYLLERGARHVYLLSKLNSIPFIEAAANPDMMAYLSNLDASILDHGPLEQSKAEFILKTATAMDYRRVIKLLVRAGFVLPTEDHPKQIWEETRQNKSANDLARSAGVK